MQILDFRAIGIPEGDLGRETRPSYHTPPNSPCGWITVLSANTILVSTLVVTLVIHSTTSHTPEVLEVMRQAKLDMPQARLAIDLAESTNANGEVILNEALDKAQIIKAAMATDPPEAFAVKRLAVTAVGGTTAAVATPRRAGLTLQATVSGTDKYYASYSLKTDSSGSVSFAIPAGAPGVVDTISVSAVLSGRTTGRKFTWCVGNIPCPGS